MASTSEGYIGIIDDEGLSTFTAIAAGAISGGALIIATSGTNQSTLSLSGGEVVYDSKMIIATVGASGTAKAIGVALANAGSTEYVSYIRKGVLVMPTNNTIVTNALVASASDSSTCFGCIGPTVAYTDVIGQALSPGTSGGYVLVRLNI